MPRYDSPGSSFTGGDHMHDIITQVMSGAKNRGFISCDSRPGATGRIAKSKQKTGPKPQTKYSRCPKCGGKVIAPCIACFPESAYDPKFNEGGSIPGPKPKRPRLNLEPPRR